MTPTTTPTINGLRLVSPEEAGVESKSVTFSIVKGVILSESKIIGYIRDDDAMISIPGNLIPLPKPRTTRPYRRGEVKAGDIFRRKGCGCDYLVTRVCNDNVFLGGDYGETTCKILLDQFDRLTYDSEGREVLGVAGIEE